MEKIKANANHLNSDPITGKHGAHPVGTGVGAAGGAVAGATIGAVAAGPVGALVGGAIGAAAGGAAGHGVGELVNPTEENAYWEQNYRMRNYVDRNRPYSDYQDAFRYGWESRMAHSQHDWKDVEADLAKGWDLAKGKSTLEWEKAKLAARDSWHRIASATSRNSKSKVQ